MDFKSKPDVSDSQSETMDLLSRAWCNFAVHEAFQTELQERSLVLHDSSIKLFDNEPKSPSLMLDPGLKMDSTESSVPAWKSNDVKSWLWMQQAMHPELNYNSCFRKKWMSWKINVPIKKWVKEIKQKRKECKRLQRAEVHAAISVAGVAAALAAIASAAATQSSESDTSKDAAMASAAALVAAQCARTAEAMGAKKDQLKTVIASAISGTTATDILTLTAAASTSLKGAATLKERNVCKNRLKGSAPVLPIEENDESHLEDFQQCLSILAKGADLNIETSNGRCMVRSVSITLDKEDKMVLRLKKLNLMNTFASKKESIVLDQHAELYKDSEGEESETCFLIVLTTDRGIIKLDMMEDYHRYRLWAMTINHMLALSTSLTRYDDLEFQKK
ncbi:VAN3-binding protein isoform X2 [Daucus carota subsp. sativus]|uniref:VAN3-binding protein isoform X2 n=1 Tax=Daucus carota subsp. sativus TaxID=79200 RepID=UPI0007B2D37F|nr:PREDICTED: VAN3-binding protein isoform X2 [Daucus carota subsp. sativus]